MRRDSKNGANATGVNGVAIVGMSGRFPGADSVDELWDNLLAGRESITHFAPDALSDLIPAETRNHPRYVPARGVMAAADRFDAAFFGIPPAEALLIDPQQRVFLELCWNALEHASVDPQRFPGTVGVYAGTSNNNYRKLVESRPELVRAAGEFATMLANEKDYVATRVAHRLDLTGPALSIHTACSTSLVAIAQAWYALMSWQCDIALAGGINIVVPQESGYVPVEGGMESEDGHCRPFDAQASGTVFSSGGAVVVLKRLADAIEQGDMIWAVIRGVAVNNDGGGKASFSSPSARGQAAVIRQALATAGVDAGSIGYVEAHGTGTQLGDPIEIEALTRAFREDTSENQFCWIGSVKSNFGHLVAASGVTGLIKAALSLHHGRIPPTINYRTPNSEINICATPFKVADREICWERGRKPRRASVSSFGVGGTNAHAVLEEAPAVGAPQPSRMFTLLPLSARDPQALKLRAADLAASLADKADADLPDIGYTLAVGRRTMAARGVVVASNIADARERLNSLSAREAGPPPRIVFLFPGQGSQHVNMARALIESEPVFRETFEKCCALASSHLGCSLRELIFPPSGAEQTASVTLAETRYTQPALFAIEYALAELWESWGYRPAAMIGHSIGEYVAACRAGVFELRDAISLVVARGAAMFAQPAGAMLAAQAHKGELARYLKGGVEIAALNGTSLTVVSGKGVAIDALDSVLKQNGIATSRLRVSHAFHSALMDGAMPVFRCAFEGIKLAPPERMFYSCVSGAPIRIDEAVSPDYWCRQLRLPVRFSAAMEHSLDEGSSLYLEIGPSQALTGLARVLLGGRARVFASLGPANRSGNAAEQLALAIGECWNIGLEPDWERYYSGESRRRQPLPGYPFRGERYWIDSVNTLPPSSNTDGETNETDTNQPMTVTRGLQRPSGTIAELHELFENLVGKRIEPADDSKRFIDLNLDSLALTQVALEVERRYGLKIKFRRLMEDLDNVIRLASFINELRSPPDISGNTDSAVPIQDRATAVDVQSANLTERPFGASARITTRSGTEFTDVQAAWVEAFTRRYTARTSKSKAFSQQHRELMADPRVVTGFNPLWKEVTYPIVVDRSKGARLWDLDGNEYIDLLNGFGANFLGYQPDYIVDALKTQLDSGIEIGPQHPLSADVAKLISEMTGMSRVAFCNTGSEAVMGAMRIARTVTGRKTIVIFKDSYHGIFDEVIVRGNRQLRSVAAAPGIAASAVENVLVLEYGSDEALDLIRGRASELAAVMIEPVQGRNPSLQPRAFVQELRRLCDAGGSALIFDEVVTGFRIGQGGAQEFYGVHADLATYGKIIGGGLPFAAIAGDGRWMDALDGGYWRFGDDSYPEAGVTYFAGTFVRHPLALAAAKASLTYLKERGPELQRELNARTGALVERLNEFFRACEAPLRAACFSSLWRVSVDANQPFASLFYYALRERGLHVYEQFNCFLSMAHGDVETDEIAERIESAVRELMAAGLLTSVGAETHDATLDIPVASPALHAETPLTDGQMEKWLACRYGEKANIAFNESFILTLDGVLNRSALERGFASIGLRHEAFALSFSPDGIWQRAGTARELSLGFVDLTGESAEAKLAAHCEAAVRQPFDLTVAPLVRVELLRLASNRHALLVVAHHLVFDGWSEAVLLDELEQTYQAAISGCEPKLEPAESYRAYAMRERARRAEGDAARQIDYWRQLYATVPGPLALPSDRPMSNVLNLTAGTVRYEFPPELVAALRLEARRHGITLYSLLLTGFGALIARLSGQRDFVIGIPFAGQVVAGSRVLIGDGVNTLPFRMVVDPDISFSDLAHATHRSLLDAAENSDITLHTILRELRLPHGSRPRPLADVIFNLNPRVRPLAFTGLRHSLRDGVKPALASDLFFNLTDTVDGLTLDLHYSVALFDAATIQRWISHYETLLSSTIQGDPRIATLPMLNETQRREVLYGWNATSRQYNRRLAVPTLFDAQVACTPDRIAVECEDRVLSYAELGRRADAVARLLHSRGVRRGDRVGVCVPRSVDMLVATLGVMKSGAAYVPLDLAFPAERLRLMASHAGIRQILTLNPETVPAPVVKGRDLLTLGGLDPESVPAATLPAVSGDDLAYVLYTSGSTGEPKGVGILHRNLVNFLLSMREQPGIVADDVVCAMTTLSFDIAGLELYLPLIVGARVLIATEDHHRDPAALVRLMHQRGATILQTTPSLLRLIVDGQRINELRNLKLLIGGEELPRDLANAIVPRCRELWNLFGPTETTIWSTVGRVHSANGPVPLGRPISNTQVYVLDALGEPVPPGVHGEIWIGGEGVGAGYLSRPDLTAERFLPDPFVSEESRIFRTGDLGSLRAGLLYYHGRLDHQIKLRGFRIEPGNIEAVALLDPGVREAVAVAREFGPNDKRLVLYVVARFQDPELIQRLYQALRAELPPYMLPQQIQPLDNLPKTPNGKIDRKVLPMPSPIPGSGANTGISGVIREIAPSPGAAYPEFEPYVTYRTDTERQLAVIWKNVLGIETVSIESNFFDLGGHSLLAVRVIDEIERVFGVKLPLTTFFQTPTIEDLARLLSSKIPQQSWSSLAPIRLKGSKPPFFWVHGEGSNAFLSRFLDSDQPLFGLMHQSEDGQPALYTSVEDIAAHYLREIRAVQSRGPYFLGGYCFGAVVAFEMAQQLKSYDEEVGLLVLLAPSLPQNTESSSRLSQCDVAVFPHRELMSDEISRHIRILSVLEPVKRRDYLMKRVRSRLSDWLQPARHFLRRIAIPICFRLGYSLPLSFRSPYILGVYFQAMKRYVPTPYSGSAVHLFLEQSDLHDSTPVWSNLISEGLTIYEVPGQHTDVVKEPHARTWCESLNSILAAAQAGNATPVR